MKYVSNGNYYNSVCTLLKQQRLINKNCHKAPLSVKLNDQNLSPCFRAKALRRLVLTTIKALFKQDTGGVPNVKVH